MALPPEYRDGWQARLAVEPLDANPHDRDAAPRCWFDWRDGWTDADYVRRAVLLKGLDGHIPDAGEMVEVVG